MTNHSMPKARGLFPLVQIKSDNFQKIYKTGICMINDSLMDKFLRNSKTYKTISLFMSFGVD